MPDDNPAVAEQEQADKDFEEGFEERAAAADGGEVKPIAKKPEAGGKPGETREPAADGGQGAAPEAGKPAEDTAVARLEERAKEFGGNRMPGDAAGEKAPDVREGVQQPGDKPGGSAPAQTLAQGNLVMDLLALPGVGDAKIGVDGKEMALKDFAGEYPEVAQMAAILGKAVAQKAVEDLVASGKFAPADSGQNLQTALTRMEFWQGVTEEHPDGRKIAASQPFLEWLGKQSPVIQAMAKTWDKTNGVAILDAYKEFKAKDAHQAKRAEQGKDKKAKDDLHRETLRGGDKPQERTDAEGKEDFDAAFHEATSKKKE